MLNGKTATGAVVIKIFKNETGLKGNAHIQGTCNKQILVVVLTFRMISKAGKCFSETSR